MTNGPAGAYSAKMDTGFATEKRANLSIDGFFLRSNGLHLAGKCLIARRDGSRPGENPAYPLSTA
jgi:hypothetical protein